MWSRRQKLWSYEQKGEQALSEPEIRSLSQGSGDLVWSPISTEGLWPQFLYIYNLGSNSLFPQFLHRMALSFTEKGDIESSRFYRCWGKKKNPTLGCERVILSLCTIHILFLVFQLYNWDGNKNSKSHDSTMTYKPNEVLYWSNTICFSLES